MKGNALVCRNIQIQTSCGTHEIFDENQQNKKKLKACLK